MSNVSSSRWLLLLGLLGLVGCGTVDESTRGDAAPPAETSVEVARVVRVRQGSSVVVDVAVTRGAFDGGLNATITGLPTGVTVAPIQIAPGATAGSLVVRADPTTAHVGPLEIKLQVMAAKMIEVPLRLYVAGRSGAPDTSFSGDGTVNLASNVPGGVGDFARDVIVDSQGRIVVVGLVDNGMTTQSVMYRLTNAGVRDATFGTDGLVKPVLQQLQNVIARPDGGYLLASFEVVVRVQRLDAAGTPVGTPAVSSITPSAVGSPVSFLRVPDGAVMVGATAFEKFTLDGVLDSAFGTAGKVTTGNSTGPAVDSKGRIVGAGNFQIGRVLPPGTVDPSFQVTFPYPANYDRSILRHVALDRQDGGYACGQMLLADPPPAPLPTPIPVLLRFRGDGTIDTTFGTNGVRTIHSTPRGDCREIVVLGDGRLLVQGHRTTSELWMLNADGSFDPGFGVDGVIAAPGSGFGALTVDEGGRAVVVGGTGGSSLFVSRYWL